MDLLLEQGGLASVTVQLVNCVLLLTLVLLVARHADNRGAYRAWVAARVCMLVAIAVIVVWFYVLPTMQPALFARVRAQAPLVLAAYLSCKGAYWLAVATGVHRLRRSFLTRRQTMLAALGLLAYAVLTMHLVPTIDGAMTFQAVLAVPALLFALLGLRREPRGRIGPKLLRGTLWGVLLLWLGYAVAFFGKTFHIYALRVVPLSLFWLANSYVDTLLDAVLTFAMLMTLIEGTHLRIESEAMERVRRGHAQQDSVVALARMSEISAGDFDAMVKATIRRSAMALDVERVSVWMFSEDRSKLTCHALYSRASSRFSAGAVLRADNLPVYFTELTASRYIDAGDAARDPRTAEFRDGYLPEHGIGAMLDVEIRGASGLVGVLCHEHVGSPRIWHGDEIAFAGFLADQLCQTLANQRALSAERRRDQLADQLRHSQKLEAIGQLVGGIAHDFNNLLCAIMGYASLAQADAAQAAREPLEQIDAASQRAAELTRKLLTFSRRRVLRKVVIEVNDVVQSTIELLRRVTRESIRVAVDLAEDAGRVLVDASDLEQVLLNLCNNAADAMPEGGVLTVQTRRLGSATVAIRVRDTGSGIEPALRQRIFEPFFTTKPEGKGTGLGLATSRGIVDQHGGSIRVESQVGVGSTFEIVLPVVAQPLTEVVTASELPVVGGSETVLVVEDDRNVRSFMVHALERVGYEVLQASDGLAAVDLYKNHPEIDVILLDSVLPTLSGQEVVTRIRARSPDLPILCTSGYLTTGSADGFCDVLAKPFTGPGLLRAVRMALDRASAPSGRG